MIISMYCPNGRVGKTTTTLALAHYAQDCDVSTCVLEFDFSPGDISSILGLDMAKTILDAADGDFDIAIQKPENEDFHVIVAGYPDYPEQLKSEDVVRILNTLESKYELIIVDIQPNFIELVIDILQLSDKIVLVLNNEQQGITRVINNINWGIKSGYMDENKFEILINKYNKKDKINYIAEAQFQYPLLATIPIINNFKGYTDERFTKHIGEIFEILLPAKTDEIKSTKGFFHGLFNKKQNTKGKNQNIDSTISQLPPPNIDLEDTDIKPRKDFGTVIREPKKNEGITLEGIDDLLNTKDETEKEDDAEILDLDKIKSENKNTDIFDVNKQVDNTAFDEDKDANLIINNTDAETNTINGENNNIKNNTNVQDDATKINEDDEEPLEVNNEEESTIDATNLTDEKETNNIIDDDVDTSIPEFKNSGILNVQENINNYISECNAKIKNLISNNQSLKNKNELLENSNNMLQKMLTDEKNEKNRINEKLQATEQNDNDIKDEHAELKRKVDNLNTELKTKSDYIESLNKQLLAKETEYKNKVSTIQQKLEEIKSTL